MAKELGVTAHALVLAWALAQGPTVIPIPSARTVAHVLDSARAADLSLSARDLESITAAPFDRS
jgi:aryl-alcohol dehydrogenase-like predicted oxidoreductase